MLCDNKKRLILIKNLENQNQTKYIDVMHNHICRLVEDGKLVIDWIKISSMLAKRLTKALIAVSFKTD